MKNLFKVLKQYIWFLYPENTLFAGNGLYSKVKVTKKGDRINLYTGESYLQTSINTQIDTCGFIFDWYLVAPWFSGYFNGELDSLLILGLGCGAQAKIYNKVYKVNKITGIEIDPLIIELGKKYFDLNDVNLSTINDDAYLFPDKTTATYSHVIVDVYKKNMFDKNCQSLLFFNKIRSKLSSNGTLFINKLRDDPDNNEVSKILKSLFNVVVTLDIYCTKFFVATNSNNAPKNAKAVKQLLLETSKSYPKLRFFNSINITNINVI